MMNRVVIIAILLISSLPAFAERFSQQQDVQDYIQGLVTEHGFSEKELVQWFDQVTYQESIIKALSRPAEKTKTFKSYKPMFVSADTIKKGRAYYDLHRVAFERAEMVYGIPAEIILAIIAIESRFGGNTGSYKVFDALATIGFFYPSRATYFKKELTEYLLFAKNQNIDPFSVKGSYAGAMGLVQFMPSSIRAYAVDFDYDGHIDLWDNPVDAIGSVANYFKRHRWQDGRPVAIRAAVMGDDIDQALAPKLALSTTVAETKAFGWVPTESMVDDEPVLPFKIETDSGFQYWYGMNNFYVITRYNHSLLYAMTVNHLSQSFEQVINE